MRHSHNGPVLLVIGVKLGLRTRAEPFAAILSLKAYIEGLRRSLRLIILSYAPPAKGRSSIENAV